MEIDTDKNEKLRKLLEFYFGDSNLMHDRFLKQKVEADPEGCMFENIVIINNIS